MNKQKFETKNRYGLKIVGELWIPEHPIGLSFVMHGLGGYKEQETVQRISKTFYENGYTVVNFDATNSFGESGGKYEDATMQLHYEDLVDVTLWTNGESWYIEPFILAGHSLGGYAVLRYAEDFPEKVKAVFPHAPVVSGELSHEASNKRGELKKWKDEGLRITESKSKPGLIKKLPWSHMEERLKHDLLPNAKNLVMPVLFIVGENDEPCPPEHNRVLFDLIPGERKEFNVVSGASHTFREPEHLAELCQILDKWLKKI